LAKSVIQVGKIRAISEKNLPDNICWDKQLRKNPQKIKQTKKNINKKAGQITDQFHSIQLQETCEVKQIEAKLYRSKHIGVD